MVILKRVESRLGKVRRYVNFVALRYCQNSIRNFNQPIKFMSIFSFFDIFIQIKICLSSEHLTKNQNKLIL